MLLLIRGGTVDISLDALNSPSITSYKFDACVERVFYGFISEDYQFIYYGANYDGNLNPTFYLYNSTFGSTAKARAKAIR